MTLDLDSPEGKALVALAKFGREVLDTDYQCQYCEVDNFMFSHALELGLVTWSAVETDLAKLPEGI